MYEKNFYFYLPLLAVVNQMTKFISNRWVLALLVANTAVNSALGKYLVD